MYATCWRVFAALLYQLELVRAFSALTLLVGRQEEHLGPDLQNIFGQSYDNAEVTINLRSTYDGRLIYKTSYNEWEAFHRQDSRAKS